MTDAAQSLRGCRVLVAEEDIVIAEELRVRLGRLGAEVLDVVDTGHSALQRVEQNRLDLVLMGVRLKGPLSGIETAESIWQRHRTPVVFLTAQSDFDAIQRANGSEPFGFLSKPINVSDLVATMAMALHRSALERKLLASEQRYAATLASIGEGVIAAERNGLVQYMNPVAEALTGWAASQASKLPLVEVLRVVCGRPAQQPGEQLLLSEDLNATSRPRTFWLLPRNGQRVPIELVATTIRNSDDGGVEGTVIAFRDVSERLAAEDELRRSEERYRTLFEDMDEGVAINEAILDANGEVVDYVILAVNPAFERQSPYKAADAIGARATDLYKLPSEYIRAWWKDHAPLKRAVHTEMYHEPSGRWLHVVASPISNGRFATMFTDVSEKKVAEAALRESEQRFRAIFDQTFQFTGLLNTDGTLIAANRSALAFYGIQESDVVGLPFWKTPWWAHSADEQARLRSALQSASTGVFVRMEVTHRDQLGNLHTVDFSLKPFLDTQGKIPWLIAEGRDITERKATEEALLRVEQERRDLEARTMHAQRLEAIGSLAAGVAHDFNNLLTVIGSCTEMLSLESSVGEFEREMIHEIQSAGERAARLTKQLLAFSRKQVLKPKVVNLNDLIGNVAQMLTRLLGEGIEVTHVPCSELWPVQVDPGQVDQVIVNLAVNARDAMPHGGKLTLTTSNVRVGQSGETKIRDLSEGNYVCLSVSDTGTGMSYEVQQRAFDPFFTTKEVGKGTGLGLSTVHGIVKQSGGHIQVESELGRGTRFCIYFPSVTSSTTGVRSQQLSQTSSRGHESVLFVEDDEAVRTIMATGLQAHGYSVLAAANGQQALEIFSVHGAGIDLLVTDMGMPGDNGRDIADKLCALKPDLRVLYVSGYTDDPGLRRGILAGNIAFLQKPFTPTELAAQLRRVLDGSQPPS